jgi:hypothetical protein
MSAPTVCCVMLANGRPEMVARAVKSFRAQTCHGARLLVYDNGDVPIVRDRSWSVDWAVNRGRRASIGMLRNEANTCANADIILHWDSDDWSHPNRIAEQVALLQSSGAACVGYNEMLFWDARAAVEVDLSTDTATDIGEAWLYRTAVPNYAIGTSMCYWRETWQRNPFPDQSEGCDDLHWFNRGVKIVSVSSGYWNQYPTAINSQSIPRMIASIHGGNTCARIDAKQREWQRVQEWDAYCREAMKL